MSTSSLISIVCLATLFGLGCVPEEQPQTLAGSYTITGEPFDGDCDETDGWRRLLFERFEFISVRNESAMHDVRFLVPVVEDEAITNVSSAIANDNGTLTVGFDSLRLDDDDGEIIITSMFILLEVLVVGVEVEGAATIRVERADVESCTEFAFLDGLRRPLEEAMVAP